MNAIKSGKIHVGYDTFKYFLATNSNLVKITTPEHGDQLSQIDKQYFGHTILTKNPSQKGSLEVTENYKYQEDTHIHDLIRKEVIDKTPGSLKVDESFTLVIKNGKHSFILGDDFDLLLTIKKGGMNHVERISVHAYLMQLSGIYFLFW